MLRATMRRLLHLLDRHARWALPAGVFAGILLPDLAALLRPWLTPAVIGTLTTALLRLDWRRLAAHAARPRLPALLALWLLVASPLVVWLAAAALGLPKDLRLALMLQAAAPPIGSAAVFALILGLDAALAALASMAATLMLPLSLTPLVAFLPGQAIEVDPAAFFLRVTLVVAAPFAIAWALRRALGRERLVRQDALLGGLNVVLLLLFAIGVMDGVTAQLLATPRAIAALLAACCIAAAALHLAGYAAFRWAGPAAALNAALLSGNRNVGLILAITAGSAGSTFSTYVGLAQIPMYFAPLLLSPLARRLPGRPG